MPLFQGKLEEKAQETPVLVNGGTGQARCLGHQI